MSSIESQHKELKELESVRFVTNALFEISSEEIKKLRAQFEKNQLFYADISDLYGTVKRKASQGGVGGTAKKNPRRLSVAFTTNTRFYGSINNDIMEAFLNHIRATKRDYLVIGDTGKTFLEYHKEEKRCRFLSFVSDQPTKEEFTLLLQQLTSYDQVFVFHPTFVNMFTQDVGVLDITHFPEPQGDAKNTSVDFVFEPELPKLLAFFETRVRFLLFQRALLEAELARTAARLTSMNSADERARDVLARKRRALRRTQFAYEDMRLIEAFSAIQQWSNR